VTEWLNWGANIRKVLSPAATKVCMLAEVTLPSWFMRNTQSDAGTATRLPVLRSVSTWQFVQLTTWRTWQALQSSYMLVSGQAPRETQDPPRPCADGTRRG
jgi:hypothetical protein